MIPERFCIEYPTRVLQLLEGLAGHAASMDLSTTFILSLAMPMLVIPLERLKSGHKFSDAKVDSNLHRELQTLMRKKFGETPFWRNDDRRYWRFAYVVKNVEKPDQWCDATGAHPLADSPAIQAEDASLENILLTLRHALSHGCVVYLDEAGHERPNRRVTQVAFVSETRGDHAAPVGSHRIVVVEEQALRRFLIAWCEWMQQFSLSPRLRLAA